MKGVKLPRKKNCFFGEFCPTSRIFLVLVLLSASVKICFVSRIRDKKEKNVFERKAFSWAKKLIEIANPNYHDTLRFLNMGGKNT